MSTHPRERLEAALAPSPTVERGGALLVLAAGGRENAVALLSTAEVHGDDDRLRIALLSDSSVVRARPSWAVLVVPANDGALRVFLQVQHQRAAGALTVLETVVETIRPTVEPPWRVSMAFSAPAGDPRAAAHVDYWTELRRWLATGAPGRAPEPPGRS